MAVMSVYSVAKVDSVVDWVTKNLYQKSQLFSDCLECVSQLPLQKEHKLNLRRCLSGFSKEMTVEEKGIAIQFLLRIISEAGVLSLRFAVLSAVFIVLRAVHSHPPNSCKDNGSKEMCVFMDEMIHSFAGCPR